MNSQKVMNTVGKKSTATVMFVSCLLCLLTTTIAQQTPVSMRKTSMDIAGIVNCLLCVLVLAKFFGFV